MARLRVKDYPIIENVLVTDIATEGQAVGKVNDMVVLISHAVPGDVVDLKVVKIHRNYLEAIPIRFVQRSSLRITPPCRHFEVCGGCKWQDMTYEKQLEYKQKSVYDQLVRLGRLPIRDIQPILPAPETYYYRNKLEFTFSPNRWLYPEEMEQDTAPDHLQALGYHIPGKFDKVLNIEQCMLQRDPSNTIRCAIRDYAIRNHMPFFHIRTHEGFLRTMVSRFASTGEIMIILTFAYEDIAVRTQLLDYIVETFPEITSLMYVINSKPHDSFADLEVRPYKGPSYIVEQMEGLRFKLGPKSFYQTNSQQACRLYQVVRQTAELTGHDVVYDLYTGIGTIANYVASQARKVIGVEYVPEAIEDARENARFNGITNTVFYAGDMKDVFTLPFVEQNGMPDVIILDPPRAGVHPKVVERILEIQPARIVYVSCNPATQARDLALLNDAYDITAVQPVDMFPQTHHVENVVQLKRKAPLPND